VNIMSIQNGFDKSYCIIYLAHSVITSVGSCPCLVDGSKNKIQIWCRSNLSSTWQTTFIWTKIITPQIKEIEKFLVFFFEQNNMKFYYKQLMSSDIVENTYLEG
jgi:hypothetical protein